MLRPVPPCLIRDCPAELGCKKVLSSAHENITEKSRAEGSNNWCHFLLLYQILVNHEFVLIGYTHAKNSQSLKFFLPALLTNTFICQAKYQPSWKQIKSFTLLTCHTKPHQLIVSWKRYEDDDHLWYHLLADSNYTKILV